MGGPGERQIELDRRMIDERIVRLKKESGGGAAHPRPAPQSSRKKVPYPVVALVGYTNAGKSTLFNRLTRADVLAEDHAVRDAGPDHALGQAAGLGGRSF